MKHVLTTRLWQCSFATFLWLSMIEACFHFCRNTEMSTSDSKILNSYTNKYKHSAKQNNLWIRTSLCHIEIVNPFKYIFAYVYIICAIFPRFTYVCSICMCMYNIYSCTHIYLFIHPLSLTTFLWKRNRMIEKHYGKCCKILSFGSSQKVPFLGTSSLNIKLLLHCSWKF